MTKEACDLTELKVRIELAQSRVKRPHKTYLPEPIDFGDQLIVSRPFLYTIMTAALISLIWYALWVQLILIVLWSSQIILGSTSVLMGLIFPVIIGHFIATIKKSSKYEFWAKGIVDSKLPSKDLGLSGAFAYFFFGMILLMLARDVFVYPSSFELGGGENERLFDLFYSSFKSIKETPLIRNAFIFSYMGHVSLNKTSHKTLAWKERIGEWRKKRESKLAGYNYP